MRQQITYIVSLFVCLLVLQNGLAQQTKKAPAKPAKNKEPLVLNGFRVETDLGQIVSSLAFKNNITTSMQVGVSASLSNKLYPTIEMGQSSTLKLMADQSSFTAKGFYEKIGVDFRINKALENGKPTNNLMLLGLRLGFSSFNYSINHLPVVDEYWGGSSLTNYDNLRTNKVWYEIMAGIRVEILKNTYVGWNVRYKSLLSKKSTGEIYPWYIPGYGTNINSTPNWEFNYTVGYYINQPTKTKKVDLQ